MDRLEWVRRLARLKPVRELSRAGKGDEVKHGAEHLVAERWAKVKAGARLVPLAGGLLDFVHPRPGLHCDAERRLRPGVGLLDSG